MKLKPLNVQGNHKKYVTMGQPIVVVPKKSQHGEPPQKRLCIDFRKINNLQQAVITEGKPKGCLSLVPLPKIDEMYAKLKAQSSSPQSIFEVAITT